jgi:hypothetical protein
VDGPLGGSAGYQPGLQPGLLDPAGDAPDRSPRLIVRDIAQTPAAELRLLADRDPSQEDVERCAAGAPSCAATICDPACQMILAGDRPGPGARPTGQARYRRRPDAYPGSCGWGTERCG